jgi:hypothetical protein
MPKFDHRFDNTIQKKEDLRFTELNSAIDYANAQCSMYGYAQSVVPVEDEPGVLKVVEHLITIRQAPLEAVYFVNDVI